MTACVNNTEKKAKGGVFQSKVLRAAMAGVLAVGMIPAMALAAEPAESEAVPMATVTPANDFSAGKVTEAVDNGDKAVDAAERAEWTVDGDAHYVIPTQVTTGKGTKVDMEVKETYSAGYDMTNVETGAIEFHVTYYKEGTGDTIPGTEDATGTPVTSLDEMKNPGTYYAVVNANHGNYTGGVVAYEFGVVAKSLEGATAYQVNGDDPKDVSDGEFVFNNDTLKIALTGGDGALNFELDGKALEATDINWAAIKIYREAGSDADAIKYGNITGGIKLYAGNYTAVITGNPSSDYEGSEAQVDFTVKPFDVTNADITLENQTAGDTHSRVGVESAGEGNDDVAAILPAEYTGDEGVLSKAGTYTFEVGLNPDSVAAETDNEDRLEASVVNTKEVSLVVMEQGYDTLVAADVWYGDEQLEVSYDVNLSDSKTLFDVDEIVVKNGDEELAADKYDVTVTDAEGNEADVADLSTPGTWTVTVTADPAANGYKLCGSVSTTVKVIAGEVQSGKNVTVMYDGKVVANSFEATYDGTDLLDKLQVTVETEDGEKTLSEGADYDVKVLDSDDKEVSEVVNAGSYELQITSDTWTDADESGAFLSETLDMTVNPLEPTYVRAAGMKTLYTADPATGELLSVTGLPYTGSEIVPTFEYTTDDIDGDFDGDVTAEGIEWKALPENAYNATYTKNNEEVKVVDVTQYKVDFEADAEDEVMSGNFDLNGVKVWGGVSNPANINVVDTDTFADVPADEWFAKPVTLAEALGYVNGYYGTKLFGAGDKITRADVVRILFNMAGGDSLDEGSSNQWIQYATQFEDVDAAQYYAEAIGWAVKSGVVSGYDDKTFGPNDKITREQTAAMISNYAKALGKHQAAEDVEGTLAAFGDGAQVSDWARAEVAWAVENGVMGNGGYLAPQDQITRAEVAAMAVNYQPAKL